MTTVHRHPRLGAGITIVEVMVAVSVLLGALVLTVGQMANVMSLQRQTNENAGISRILKSLTELVSVTDPNRLGTTDATWSIARYQDGTGSPPLTAADLVAMELAPLEMVNSDVNVFFEYYRMVDFTNPTTGVVSTGLINDPQQTHKQFVDLAYIQAQNPLAGIKTDFRLSGWTASDTSAGNSPFASASVLAPTHPVMIRILATWDRATPAGPPRQYREVFTARSHP